MEQTWRDGQSYSRAWVTIWRFRPFRRAEVVVNVYRGFIIGREVVRLERQRTVARTQLKAWGYLTHCHAV